MLLYHHAIRDDQRGHLWIFRPSLEPNLTHEGRKQLRGKKETSQKCIAIAQYEEWD